MEKTNPSFSENAEVILQKRYYMKDDRGNVIEDAAALLERVSQAVDNGNLNGSNDNSALDYYNIMAEGRFLPNSPTLVNAGKNGQGCLSACFVVSPEDNMKSIMQVASDAAMIEKWGGGIGFGFSDLRPKKDRIATTHGEACGPVAVMKLYSSVGATLTQGSFRLGAHMGQLIITHPDIREFIHCKDNDDTLSNFNISVQITDDFMKAVDDDRPWPLLNPRDVGNGPANDIVDVVSARDLWREICESAWKTGDPGVVFIDRVWETAPNPQMGKIKSSNPCGEEMLENYGNCCLGSINLDRHTREVQGKTDIDYDQLEDTVRKAVRFLNNVIEINEFPLEKLREVNLATRRIGLGVMGWADVLVRLGVAYDSEEGLRLADHVAQFIVDTAWKESAEIAKEYGPFSEYETSALKEKGMPPVRNSSVFTIAPTGTISRLADCSSGIEPHFATAWWSNVLWDEQDSSSERLLDAPKSVRETLARNLGSADRVQSVLGMIADNPDSAENILRENGIDPAIFRTAMSISPEAHIRMQAAWQKHVTNSVSKTINLPNSATIEDVADAYRLAWELGCKAVTVYRDGSKSLQVLETGKSDDSEEEDEKSSPKHDSSGYLVPLERQSALMGITEKVRTGHGTMYVTLNFDDKGMPFELFTAIGKAGGSEPAHLEGISRLVSLALRSGVDPNAIIHHLSGITSEPVWDSGVLIRSAEDGVAHVLRKYVNSPPAIISPTQVTDASAQLGLFNGQEQGRNRAGLGGSACPKCSGRVVHQEGCIRCLECGYTKCE